MRNIRILGSSGELSWSIDLIHPERYLLVQTHGPITSSSWPACAQAVVAATATCQCTSLLIDHRDSVFQFSTMETYMLPRDFNALTPPPGFTAAVAFAGPSAQTRFLDDRFTNTGTRAHVFYDFDHAKQWLLKVIHSQTYTPPTTYLPPGPPPPPVK